MSHYVALYRKYRPTSFAELVGQEPVARTLAAAIKQGRLGHAYLFCGPRGTGKTSVARILAKSVNCETGPTDFPCGACSNCKEITNGTCLDVIEIDAASNNGVDNIRDLQDRVALAPVSGRFKVYIIDEVHMLSQGAFNALLKTLEEPPPNVLFVLATTDPHKVLPTIISRCQRFDFGRIPLGALAERVRYVSEQEGIQIDRAGVEAIARRANGGLRDALSLLDQIAAMAAGAPVTAAEVAASLGLLSGEAVCQLGRALLEADVPTALAGANALLQAGAEHATVLRELMAHFRHLMLLQLAPERAEALDVPTGQLSELKAQAAMATASELPWILEVLNETEGTIRKSPQQAIWLELGLIKVATRPSIPSFTELVDRVAALEAAIAGGAPLPAPRPQPVPTPVRPAPPPAPVAAPPQVAPAAPVAPPAPMAPPAPPAPVVEDLPPPPMDLPPAPPPAPDPLGLPPSPFKSGDRPAPAPVAAKPKPEDAPPPPPTVGGQRPVPPGAWDRVKDYVRSKSVPTAALLDQQAAVDRWEADGAVVVRIAKGCKDMFEKQPAKKKVLGEGIVHVFGAGTYPRLEVGDPKAPPPPSGGGARPASPPPSPAPAAPAPSFAPPPVAPPATPPASSGFDEIPLDDAPPAWLDELEDSRPEPDGARPVSAVSAVPAQPAPPAATASAPSAPTAGPAEIKADDMAMKLTMELFNGRIVPSGDGPKA